VLRRAVLIAALSTAGAAHAEPVARLLPTLPTPAQLAGPALTAPPPPPRTGARLLIVTGAALMVTGVIGMLASPGCRTHAADGRCVDAQGSHGIFPALVVMGLGATTTGAWWLRHDIDLPSEE
jgi:hypothetical protein